MIPGSVFLGFYRLAIVAELLFEFDESICFFEDSVFCFAYTEFGARHPVFDFIESDF